MSKSIPPLQFSVSGNGAAVPVFFNPKSGGNFHDVRGTVAMALGNKSTKPGESKMLCLDGKYRTNINYSVRMTQDYASALWGRLNAFIGPLPAALSAERFDLMNQINRGISIKVNDDVTASAYILAVTAYPGERLRNFALASGACANEDFTVDHEGHYLFSPVDGLAIPTVGQPEGLAQAILSACIKGNGECHDPR